MGLFEQGKVAQPSIFPRGVLHLATEIYIYMYIDVILYSHVFVDIKGMKSDV